MTLSPAQPKELSVGRGEGVGGLGGVFSKVYRNDLFNLNIIHPPGQWAELH